MPSLFSYFGVKWMSRDELVMSYCSIWRLKLVLSDNPRAKTSAMLIYLTLELSSVLVQTVHLLFWLKPGASFHRFTTGKDLEKLSKFNSFPLQGHLFHFFMRQMIKPSCSKRKEERKLKLIKKHWTKSKYQSSLTRLLDEKKKRVQ